MENGNPGLVEVIAIVGATIFAGYQLRALRLQSSADLCLRLGQELERGTNQQIIDALDVNPDAPLLKRSKGGGKFTVVQLDNYLSEYETLADFYRNGLITCPMLYNEFSTDLESAYKNKDVIAQIAKERKDDPTYWQGFLNLGKQFDQGYHCQ